MQFKLTSQRFVLRKTPRPKKVATKPKKAKIGKGGGYVVLPLYNQYLSRKHGATK